MMRTAIRTGLFILFLAFICICFSCSSDGSGGDTVVEGYLCSGPEGGSHSTFAPGVIDSLGATVGIRLGNMTTNGSYENVRLLARSEGKMGLILEDTFKYAIRKGID